MAAPAMLRTPLGRRVKVVERGAGTPVVFLHSGVGSAGEWKQVFSLWPDVLFDDALLTTDALAAIHLPVHVIEGSQTSAVDHAICDVFRRHVPGVQHTLIGGAGHMMPLTHPEPLTHALLAALEP